MVDLPKPRLVIAGASGSLGRDLVPLAQKAGFPLLLLGRTKEHLEAIFPDLDVDSYEAIKQPVGYRQMNGGARLKKDDVLLFLAVRNNDTYGTAEEFHAANVNFLQEIMGAARVQGVSRIIYPASTHTSDESLYGSSKAAAEAWLRASFGQEFKDGMREEQQDTGATLMLLRLPAVYGSRRTGKLALVDKVPKPLQRLAFTILAALKPTVAVGRVFQAIIDFIDASEEDRASPKRRLIERVVSDGQQNNLIYCGATRVLDVIFALVVILGFWWLMILIWTAVRLTSPGPGFFKQSRVGREEKTFTCYKFRTMKSGTKQVGTHEVSETSVTAMGRLLRKTKLDELPQVLNILKNELSLVGPRPNLPNQAALIAARRREGVYDVKPGITGWSQVQNIDMSRPEELAVSDARYIAMRGLILDLRILMMTFTGHGLSDKVSTDK